MLALPGHGLGKLHHGVNRIQQTTVPVVLEDAPTAFDGVVLAVIWRIICQTYIQMLLVDELDHAMHEMHELGASAMVFWSVI